MSRRAVFLDRDGVINRAMVRDGLPYPPSTPEEVEILPGVDEQLRRLKREGFVLIVVSNQPDVARGTARRETVEAINGLLAARLPIDRFITCFHDQDDDCGCRKPKPGMLMAGAREFDIDLKHSIMVGDRWRDMEAGKAAGCRTIYVDHGYRERRPDFFDGSANSAEAALAEVQGRIS
jgi:D-glycero-D-manno-heptose 1,7-bisphosphate phosphatase